MITNLKEIKNMQIPEGVYIFPNIYIQETNLEISPILIRHFFYFSTYVPISRNKNAYLVPIIQRGESSILPEKIKEVKQLLLDNIMIEADNIQKKYNLDEHLLIEHFGMQELIYKYTY